MSKTDTHTNSQLLVMQCLNRTEITKKIFRILKCNNNKTKYTLLETVDKLRRNKAETKLDFSPFYSPGVPEFCHCKNSPI